MRRVITGLGADGRSTVMSDSPPPVAFHATSDTGMARVGGRWGGWTSLGGILTSDPAAAADASGRVWVVGRRGSGVREPTFGRERRLIASDQNAVLLLYDGPSCAGQRGSLTKRAPA